MELGWSGFIIAYEEKLKEYLLSLRGKLMKHILGAIQRKMEGGTQLLAMADSLSGSKLNSLLLAFFQKWTSRIKPTDLVKQFSQNRFVQPAGIDTIKYKELELEYLRI